MLVSTSFQYALDCDSIKLILSFKRFLSASMIRSFQLNVEQSNDYLIVFRLSMMNSIIFAVFSAILVAQNQVKFKDALCNSGYLTMNLF